MRDLCSLEMFVLPEGKDMKPLDPMKEPRLSDCRDFCPPQWTGHWREWHRGHGCNLDPDAGASEDRRQRIERLKELAHQLRLSSPRTQDLADDLERLLTATEACPCLHAAPCSPECTCVHAASSRGCSRCCSYGSKEQRAKNAEYLVAKDEAIARLTAERDIASRSEDDLLRRVTDVAKAVNKAYGSAAVDLQDIPLVVAALVKRSSEQAAEIARLTALCAPAKDGDK